MLFYKQFKEYLLLYNNMKKKKYNNSKYNELLDSIKKHSKNVPLYNIFFDNPNKLKTNSIFDMYSYSV